MHGTRCEESRNSARISVRNGLRSPRSSKSNHIVEELPQIKKEAVRLVRRVVAAGRHVYVLVNNRAERNVPLTVQALFEVCCTRWSIGVENSCA